VVMRSLEDADGLRCVDIVTDGVTWTWHWCECRRDPEDGHGWRHTGARGAGFETQDAACADAAACFDWIAKE